MSTVRRGTLPVVRVLAALVFIYAGWIKIQVPQAFADSIAAFHLLPTWLNNLLALGLPPFEMIVGGWLLGGWKIRTAAFCALAACLVFLLALGSAMVRGLPVECGCFGEAHSSLPPTWRVAFAIGRDVLLGGAIAIVYVDTCRKS